MRRRPGALLLLLLLGALCLAEQCGALRAESAALKRKKKRKSSSDPRQLHESPESPSNAYVEYAVRRYLSNTELTERLQDFEKRCKHIAQLVKIGSSAQGRPIWAIEISDNPGKEEAEPAVKYIGNVHGDEPTGRVLTLALAEWLCANHKSDPRAKRIVQNMHLWLVPAMNPDGFEQRSRANSAGQDLNRDFPDRFYRSDMTASGMEQPETTAMMEWTLRTGFVASASMHEGALVANYPWDGTPDHTTAYQACPDDATFRHLAQVYATTHRKMAKPDNTEFPNGGITNGAAWYPIYGSMQDWNYIVAKCMELTLELSPRKWPAEEGLAELWEDNRDALLAFPLAAAYGGVWGSVREEGKLRSQKGAEEALPTLGGAKITVLGLEEQTVTSRAVLGDYYRPLAPGRYTIVVTKDGYKPFTVNVTVPSDGSGAQRHFVLARDGSSASGAVAYSLKSLARGEVSAGSLGAAGLDGARDLVFAAGSRAKHHMLLLLVGALVVHGLYVTHKRLQRRAHQRKA